MKKIISGLTVFILLAVFNYGIAQEPNLLFEPGKLIIKSVQALNVQVSGNTGVPSIDSLNSYYGVSSIEQIFSPVGLDPEKLAIYNQIGLGRFYALTLPDSTDILKAMETYKNIPAVEYAEPNSYLKPLDVYPCDEMFQYGFQWGLWNTGSDSTCNPRADIKAPEAWQIEKGDSNLIVGIVDSGIRRRHDSSGEIANRVWVNLAERNGHAGVDDDHNGFVDDSIGWNFVTNTPFVEPESAVGCLDCDHGTHVAYIIGRETDSTNGCYDGAGINWKCKLMNLKVDYCVWNGDICDLYFGSLAISRAIYYGTLMGAKVLNLSFGGLIIEKHPLGDSNQIIEDVLINAYLNGVVSIAAMGNGEDLYTGRQWALYPAFSEYTLAVGATDCKDDRVIHYNQPPYWESSYDDFLPHIDLVAPGLDIYTLQPTDLFAGTSAATPFVSGIASLVITHRKKLIPTWNLTDSLGTKSIYEVLRHTADDTVGHTYSWWGELEDTPCRDGFYGWGRANAFKALVAVSHGDANNDSRIDVVDVTYLVSYLFKGGPPPVPALDMGDSNCDKRVTIADVVYLVGYLYKGGPPPALCYTDCSQP